MKTKTFNPILTKLWGGFVSGRLHTLCCDTGFGGYGAMDYGKKNMPAIFKNKKDALRQYRDVRRVHILVEVSK